MENFVFRVPTKIIFGRETEMKTGKEVRKFSQKVLLHYGSGSIKKSGLYDRVVKSLKEQSIEIFELSGVKPNPRLSLVYEGIKICRENKINFILAVGGGSVIDSAKAIAAGINFDGDVWDLYNASGKKAQNIIPVGVILTIPAAGSEMSNGSVITNEEGSLKRYFIDENIRPQFAILNPQLTFSLPSEQTSYGISDILAHMMERYFTQVKNVDLTDRLLEGAIISLMKNSYLVKNNTHDYDVRAEIMWVGTIAHNDLLGTGRIGDWASHNIEHELSAIYDIAHGAGLSIVFPAWMKYVYKNNVNKFAQFAQRIFGVETYLNDIEGMALEGIRRLEEFYSDINLPIRLSELKIDDSNFKIMAKKCIAYQGPIGNFASLNENDVLEIFKISL